MINELESCMFAESITFRTGLQSYFSRTRPHDARLKTLRLFLDTNSNIIYIIDGGYSNDKLTIKTTSMANCKENEIFLEGDEFENPKVMFDWFKSQFRLGKPDVGANDTGTSKADNTRVKPKKK